MPPQLIAALFLIFMLVASPAAAGAKYTSGGPELSASIAGSNEVAAGQTVPLNVVIQNSGLIESKMVGSTVVERTDLPNTAKSVTVGLVGTSGIAVESDPQMIGDIPGGTAAKATFVVRIPAGTSSGTYPLPLLLTYTYLASAEQIGADSIDYQYQDVHETIPLTLVIRPEAVLAVTNVVTESLNVGTEGYLNLTVTNAGAEPATNAIVRLARNGQSPITPVDSSAYVGAFAPGQSVNLRYKVAVSSEAAAQSYPIDVVVGYDDRDGINRSGRPVTIGVPDRRQDWLRRGLRTGHGRGRREAGARGRLQEHRRGHGGRGPGPALGRGPVHLLGRHGLPRRHETRRGEDGPVRGRGR